jgi:hypothetical protein
MNLEQPKPKLQDLKDSMEKILSEGSLSDVLAVTAQILEERANRSELRGYDNIAETARRHAQIVRTARKCLHSSKTPQKT